MKSPLDFVLFRDMTKEDESFIFDSWIKSYINSDESKHVPKNVYYPMQHKVVEDTINSTNVKIAHHFEDINHVLGYIVYENEEPNTCIVHWLFVKKPFRKNGIGNKLWQSITEDAVKVFHTHSSFTHNKIKDKFKSEYNPYLKIGIRI